MLKWMLGAGLVALAGAAGAQERVVVRGPGAGYPPPGAQAPVPPPPRMHVAPPTGRWGSKVDGRWWGGANAPGGWAAYRRPVRGYALPIYWNSPRFRVVDYSAYGLRTPPTGYYWSRYYDDAVLIDGRGSVYDSVYGIDWDRFDRSRYGDEIATYPADRVYPDYRRDGRGADYPPPPPPAPSYGGYDYGADYAAPPPPPPPPPQFGGGRWVSPDGSVVVTTTAGTIVPNGYVSSYGGGVTTVTVQTQPAVTTTTTTTEYVEDAVTYTRPAKRVYRAPTKLMRRR